MFAECWSNITKGKRLSHYAQLVISITASLIILGTGMILISDWNDAFKGMPVWAKIWNALFASITTRTAGFDTVAPGSFSSLGQVIMIFLMVIGASPASTGGGIKTTTIAVLAISVWNELHGRRRIYLYAPKDRFCVGKACLGSDCRICADIFLRCGAAHFSRRYAVQRYNI